MTQDQISSDGDLVRLRSAARNGAASMRVNRLPAMVYNRFVHRTEEDTGVPHCPQCGYDLPGLRHILTENAGYCIALQIDATPFLMTALSLCLGVWARH